MAARFVFVLLAICLIASGTVGRLAIWGSHHGTAFCCCGPHDATERCHCLDCPTADGDAADSADGEQVARQPDQPDQPDQPVMKRCVQDSDSAVLQAGVPMALPAAVATRLAAVMVLARTPLAAPAPEPARARLEKPPQAS